MRKAAPTQSKCPGSLTEPLKIVEKRGVCSVCDGVFLLKPDGTVRRHYKIYEEVWYVGFK